MTFEKEKKEMSARCLLPAIRIDFQCPVSSFLPERRFHSICWKSMLNKHSLIAYAILFIIKYLSDYKSEWDLPTCLFLSEYQLLLLLLLLLPEIVNLKFLIPFPFCSCCHCCFSMKMKNNHGDQKFTPLTIKYSLGKHGRIYLSSYAKWAWILFLPKADVNKKCIF